MLDIHATQITREFCSRLRFDKTLIQSEISPIFKILNLTPPCHNHKREIQIEEELDNQLKSANQVQVQLINRCTTLFTVINLLRSPKGITFGNFTKNKFSWVWIEKKHEICARHNSLTTFFRKKVPCSSEKSYPLGMVKTCKCAKIVYGFTPSCLNIKT